MFMAYFINIQLSAGELKKLTNQRSCLFVTVNLLLLAYFFIHFFFTSFWYLDFSVKSLWKIHSSGAVRANETYTREHLHFLRRNTTRNN